MNPYDRWSRMLGLRQQAYQSVFGEGGPGHSVLVDLAEFCCAFKADADGIDKDKLLTMHGRRQVYFRILDHLKLSPMEIEAVYHDALLARARMVPSRGAEDPEEA